jgi:cobalt-zinc-cadmium efflux system membrane fusion protein
MMTKPMKYILFASVLVGAAVAVFYEKKTLLAAISMDAPPYQAGSNSSGPEAYQLDGEVIEAADDALGPAGVQVAKVEARDVPVRLTLTGRTAFNMETVTHVRAQFGGKITDVRPKLGDKVLGPAEPGGPTIMCVIESNDLAQAKSAWIQAKIQLKIDDDALARTKELVKNNVLAEKFLIDAESAVLKDQAALDAARQQLLIFGLAQTQIDGIAGQVGRQRMDYAIACPRTGVVAEKGVAGGEIADPTVNLFTIADTHTMWVVGDVYERDLQRIKVGQAMKTFFTSEPTRARECKIEWISPTLDPNTHSIRVQGVLDNADGHLLSDMYGTMIVTVADGNNSLIVPADAVIREGTDSIVFVQVSRNGGKTKYRRTPVKVDSVNVGFGASETASAAGIGSAARNSGRQQQTGLVRVIEGLQSGDMIVVSGGLGLFNEMTEQAKGQAAGPAEPKK